MFKRLQNLHVRADTNSPTTIFGKNEPEVALVNESTRIVKLWQGAAKGTKE